MMLFHGYPSKKALAADVTVDTDGFITKVK